ncbi:hypothetical protein [Chryseobacterium flavum]|uniref:hypothetical protein n=1 Tax=Chryseobacterium flavum TaxID=415851 RepID=UPI0028B1706A|nr:hypothetical protein [Chryseobacterium flavum]
MKNKTGLTKDTGWQFGIRRTLPLPLENVWNIFFSEEGLKHWAAGVDQNFSTYKEFSHIRTKWKHKNFNEKANLQIRFIPSKTVGKTTISIHVDQLLNESQREETQKYWSAIMKEITGLIAG